MNENKKEMASHELEGQEVASPLPGARPIFELRKEDYVT